MTDDDSRTVLLEPADVRAWADEHGAVPVPAPADERDGPDPDDSADRDGAASGGDGLPFALSFASAGSGDEHVQWDAFLETLEDAGLALRVDGSDHEFVDRARVTGTGDGAGATREERREATRRARARRRSTVEDSDAERREDEAADQENVDGHRDEEPFQS